MSNTFDNCTKLTAVVLPASLERIETYAFYNCADLRHVTYAGTARQWEALPIGSSNTYLTNAPVFRFETGTDTIRFEKNCVNSGLFCELCYDFIQKDHQWSGTHAYGGGADLVCDDCGYTRVPRSTAVSQQPKTPEITLFTGTPDLTGALLAVTCSDGSVFTVPVTGDMLGNISNTQLGEISVTVTAYDCQAQLLLQVVPGIPDSMTLVQIPGQCSYVLGDEVHAEGIQVEADYGKYGKVMLTAADLPAPKADTSKVGQTTAVIALGDATVEFEIYVHDVLHTTLDASLYPESSHNYAPNTDDTHCFTYIGARSITVTFSPLTMLENQYDFLYIYDGSSVTYKIKGDTVRVNCDNYLYLTLTRTAGNQLTVVQCEGNEDLAGLVLTWNEE